MSILQKLGRNIQKYRYWCILLALYLVAWINPFRWMEDWWQRSYPIQAAQPFVLIGFAVSLWGRRHTLTDIWENVNRTSRNSSKIKREGNLSLLIIGCLLYFFAHFSRLALAAILGLILILLGMIFRVYGKQILRSILAPIFYLLLIVPWLPESFTGKFDTISLKIHLIFSQQLFLRLGKSFINEHEVIINGSTMPLNFELYGSPGIFSAIVFFWAFGLYKQYSAQRIVQQVLLGCIVSFILHQIRFITACATAMASQPLSHFISSVNSWFFTIISIALTFLTIAIARKTKRPIWLNNLIKNINKVSNTIQKPVDRVFEGSLKAGASVGKGISKTMHPLVWVTDKIMGFFTQLGKLLGQSNRNLDRVFRKSDRYFQNRKKKK